jgi:hypothetical protein
VREERGDVRVPGRIRDEGRSFASGSLDVRYEALKEADVRPAATTCSPSLAKRLQSCAPSPRSGPTPMSPLSAWKSSGACRPEPCDDGRSG